MALFIATDVNDFTILLAFSDLNRSFAKRAGNQIPSPEMAKELCSSHKNTCFKFLNGFGSNPSRGTSVPNIFASSEFELSVSIKCYTRTPSPEGFGARNLGQMELNSFGQNLFQEDLKGRVQNSP